MIEFRANKNPIRRLSINLGVPVSDDQYDVAGEQLAVWNSPNAGDTIYVKLDDNSNDSIPLRRGIAFEKNLSGYTLLSRRVLPAQCC